MEKKEQGQEMLARMAELFDLPVDLVAGLCHVELLGDRQLFLQGHRGILCYGTEQIDISLGGGALRICGSELALRGMTDDEVRIQGKITGVEFLK